MKADLKAIGPKANFPRYLVSGGTKIRVGEPVHSLATSSSGVANVNTYVLAAADTPVVGTHRFGGIANEDALLAAAGTVLEQFLNVSAPVPSVGRVRGKAETTTNVDTLSELAGLCGDYVLIDYNSTGATDGGPLYTIKDAASADTSGLEITGGNIALQTLDVALVAVAYRHDYA